MEDTQLQEHSAETGAARRVAVNTLNPFAAQVFTKALMLGYAVVQYRILGAEANGVLGHYFLAGLVLMYTGTISDWGLGTLLTREVAKEHVSVTADDAVGKLFRQTLALRLAISLALFVPVAIFIALYLSLFGLSMAGAWTVAILTFSLLPNAFSSSVAAMLYAHERMSLPALVGIGTSALNVALGVGAIALGWGIIGLAMAAFASTCVTAAIFWRILRRDFPQISVSLDLSGLRLNRQAALALLKTGWPLMLNALLVGLFFRVDQFIVQPVVGGIGVEQYQAAYSFLNFVLLITPAVTLALFPRMARHAVADRPRLAYEYTFALKALLILAVPIMALTVWFAPLLITVVTGGKSGYLPNAALALQILIFFLPFSFINGVTQYVLIALDKQRLITGAFAVTLVFNVGANLLLVPWLGISGAALTTVLSEIVLLGPFLWWAGRELGALPVGALVLKPLAAGALLAVIMWLLWGLSEGWQLSAGAFALYIGVGILLAAIYTAIMFILRPFNGAEMRGLRGALRYKA